MSKDLNKATRGSIIQIILSALSTGNKYGYEICKYIEEATNGKVVLKQPSLYSCLKRLEDQQYISSYWEDSEIGGKRHYYSLTDLGRNFFEENKKNWSTGVDLLNNLPLSSIEEDIENAFSDDVNDDIENNELNSNDSEKENADYLDKETNNKGTVLAAQGNLFDLAKNNLIEDNNNEIKINNEELNENKDSFFQFDLFNQNLSLIKSESINKDINEIPTFKNKFNDMDNNSSEIEDVKPKTNNKIPHISAFNKNEKLDENKEDKIEGSELNLLTNHSEESKLNSITSPPIMKQYNITHITRYDINTTQVGNLEKVDVSGTDLQDNILFNDTNNDNGDNTLSTSNTEYYSSDSNSLSDSEKSFIENRVDSKSNDNENSDISWNFESDTNKENAIFNKRDYKSVVGQLYSNSRLEDPYEKNKYHAFKEIFPTSKLNEKREIKNYNFTDEKVESLIKSSKESNINCDDLKNLNTLFNLQGIQVKSHISLENSNNTKYTDKNKLHMISSWLISIVMLLEIMFSYIVLKGRNLIYPKQSIIYFLAIAFTLNFCLISTFENYFDRFRLIVIKKNFNKSFLIRLFIFILLIVVIFATNIICGMSSLKQVEYLSYWLLPTILATNLLLYLLVYKILYKSKNFTN